MNRGKGGLLCCVVVDLDRTRLASAEVEISSINKVY